MKNITLIVLLLAATIASCRKTDISASNLNEPVLPAPTAGTTYKDSAIAYSKNIYLWDKQITPAFAASAYTDLSQMMTGIRQFSIEPGFGQPVDRWSFAIEKKEWDNASAGLSGDFGMGVFFRAENDLRVKLVEPSSPAGQAGIRRGWRIVAINGNTSINTANIDFIADAIFKKSTASITFQKPDNSSVQLTINTTNYKEQPVLHESIFDIASQKIGYFVFNSFMGDTSQVYRAFQDMFGRFTSAGITDLIVDLRYNGGGYVSVQEKLANYLVPSSANGSLMMKQQFNDQNTQYNSVDVFRKIGGLNLSRIFFIVSNSTASASELLINNLRPYLPATLIGPGRTYGKPVGFFPIPVGNWYILPVSFRTTNSQGEGNYFNGFAVSRSVADGLDRDWGDVNESCLSAALNMITGGSVTQQEEQLYREIPAVKAGNLVLDEPEFKGTVYSR